MNKFRRIEKYRFIIEWFLNRASSFTQPRIRGIFITKDTFVRNQKRPKYLVSEILKRPKIFRGLYFLYNFSELQVVIYGREYAYLVIGLSHLLY